MIKSNEWDYEKINAIAEKNQENKEIFQKKFAEEIVQDLLVKLDTQVQ